VLVLWDVDYTLVNAGGLGTRLYEAVFREMFGRELPAVAPKAGRTDRAIVLDTLTLAGIPDADRHVDSFLTELARQVLLLDGQSDSAVVALPGAAEAIAALAGSSRVRQSVLTGNIRPLAELKLRAAGLGDGLNFDAGAYGDAHEVRAELVYEARQAASQVFGEDFTGPATVLVGDTPLDVAAALTADARAVGVATGSYSADQLAAAGAHAVLSDLTNPDQVRAAVTGSSLLTRRRQDPALNSGGHGGRAVTDAELAERAQQVGLHGCCAAPTWQPAEQGHGRPFQPCSRSVRATSSAVKQARCLTSDQP
jgi:phosphoglycolate phosphatase